MYPSAPPTVNEVVRDGRDFGSRVRVGRYSTTFSRTGSAAAVAVLAADVPAERGWPTLQLSR
jgi:hypothetical protein